MRMDTKKWIVGIVGGLLIVGGVIVLQYSLNVEIQNALAKMEESK